MKILALEFSSRNRSVAVGNPSTPRGDARGRSAEPVAPSTPVFTLIEAALRAAGLPRAAVEGVAVGLGPGSATGIRAAIAVAQGWQLARGVPVAGLNSLDVLAAGLQAAGRRGRVDLVSDAQRGEWHLAGYELDAAGVRLCEPLTLVSAEDVRARLRAGRAVLGPEAERLGEGAVTAWPEAEFLARLAAQATWTDHAETLAPLHLRAPAFVKAAPPPPAGA